MKIQVPKREDGSAQPWAEDHALFSFLKTEESNIGYPDDHAQGYVMIDPLSPDIALGDYSAIILLYNKCH
jgi:hypothetical protein